MSLSLMPLRRADTFYYFRYAAAVFETPDVIFRRLRCRHLRVTLMLLMMPFLRLLLRHTLIAALRCIYHMYAALRATLALLRYAACCHDY